MKQISAIVMALVLFVVTPLSVQAHSVSEDAALAGHHLATVIELIVTRYVGDEVSVDELLEAALRGMTDILDQYSAYLSAAELAEFTNNLSGRLVGIGVSMQILEDGNIVVSRVLPDSPALEVGILPGDILLTVEGQDIQGKPLEFVSNIITNPDYENVTITVYRDGVVLRFDIQKAEIRSPTVLIDRFDSVAEADGLGGMHNYRYVQISTIGTATAHDVRTAVQQMQAEGVNGIIIDLRGNTGGYLDVTMDIANQFVPQGIVLQTQSQSGRVRTYSSMLTQQPFENIVVLVNRFTASAAEVIASSLQDSGAAIVIGEPTFGKGLVQTVYALPTGGALKLTTEEFFRRNGGPINHIGVIPCIEVERRTCQTEPDHALRRGLEVLAGL